MKLTDEIFREICNHKNPGMFVHGEAKCWERGWMDTADIFLFLDVIYSITRGSFGNPPDVLELGTSDGTSSLAFLKALSEMDGPPMDTVDISNNQDLASQMVQHFELKRWWNNHIKTTADFFSHNQRMYDIILIDADHTYKGALSDFNNSLRFLKQDGIIMIHDAFMHSAGHEAGCGKLVHEILKDPNYSSFVSTIPHCVLLVQRKEDILRHFPNE